MKVHVAFTPDEAASAPTGIVVDVVRATSTIAQALSAGYRRVLCVPEIEQARALRADLAESIVGGERDAVRIDGFDAGASPREFLEPRAEALILSTTNGTRTIVTAAERCDEVLIGSLPNLGAVVRAVAERGEDVAVICAGYKGAFAFDDAYCAGGSCRRSAASAPMQRSRPPCSRRPIRMRSTASTRAPTARRGSKRTLPSAPARAGSRRCHGSPGCGAPPPKSRSRPAGCSG
jgi:hypothetical protein